MASSDERADPARFLQTVRSRADAIGSDDEARRAATAVLGELGECLTAGAADRLADALPAGVGTPLSQTSRQAGGAGADEFLAAVARREGSDDAIAVAAHVQAVLRAVAETAGAEVVGAVREQPTAELRGLLADEREGDTAQGRAAGPRDPQAPSLAGPEQRVR